MVSNCPSADKETRGRLNPLNYIFIYFRILETKQMIKERPLENPVITYFIIDKVPYKRDEVSILRNCQF